MTAPTTKAERTRHPTLWTVEALRWKFGEHAPEDEKGPGVQLGESINTAEVPDRSFAIAVAHHFLDRFAEEAAGRMSLEIHVHPPEQGLNGENQEGLANPPRGGRKTK